MKPRTFTDTPSWIFEVNEVSANVFKVCGRDIEGRTVESTGTHPDALVEECREAAREMIKNA